MFAPEPVWLGNSLNKTYLVFILTACLALVLAAPQRTLAQSQALNGQIEVNSIFQVNGVVTTDTNGNLTAPLPDFRTRNPVALDSRQFQLGFKFNF